MRLGDALPLARRPDPQTRSRDGRHLRRGRDECAEGLPCRRNCWGRRGRPGTSSGNSYRTLTLKKISAGIKRQHSERSGVRTNVVRGATEDQARKGRFADREMKLEGSRGYVQKGKGDQRKKKAAEEDRRWQGPMVDSSRGGQRRKPS